MIKKEFIEKLINESLTISNNASQMLNKTAIEQGLIYGNYSFGTVLKKTALTNNQDLFNKVFREYRTFIYECGRRAAFREISEIIK